MDATEFPLAITKEVREQKRGVGSRANGRMLRESAPEFKSPGAGASRPRLPPGPKRKNILNRNEVSAGAKRGDGEAINRPEILLELADMRGLCCQSLSDKYQVLQKRDELISKLRVKTTDVKEAHKLTSSCPDMCPEKERYVRQLGNHLHQYEVFPNGRINPAATVKDYARSAADQDEPLSHELRPPDVLSKTMDYLISKINASVTRHDLPRLYDFIWSRSRSIRKEITQQQLTDRVAVSLVEKCARFHIYASFAMAGFDVKDFDARMNTENLSKCLQTLRHLYDDLAKKAIFCDTEAEFRAYDVLLNLRNSNVLSVASAYRQTIQDSHEFRFAMRLACNFQSGNYVAFFRLVNEKATFLQAALCYMFFDQMRLDALRLIVRVYKNPAKYSLSTLTNLLEFDSEEETRLYVEGMDMTVDDGVITYSSSTDFQQSSTEAFGKYVVQKKLSGPLANVIANGDVPVPQFPPPINSFSADGYYENDPVLRNFFLSIEPSLNLRAVRRYSSTASERSAPVEMKHPADPAFRDSPPPFNEESSSKSAFTNPFDKMKTDADGRMVFGADKSAFNAPVKQKVPSRLGSDQPAKPFGGFTNPLKAFMDKAKLGFIAERPKVATSSDAMGKLKPTVKSDGLETGKAFGTPMPALKQAAFGSSRLMSAPSESANSASFNFTTKPAQNVSLTLPIPAVQPSTLEQPLQKTAEELAEEKRIREKSELDAREAAAKAERQRRAEEERRKAEAEAQRKREEEERKKRLLAEENERRRKEAEEKASEEERQRKIFRKERAQIFRRWAPQTAKWLSEELLDQAFDSIINNVIERAACDWKEDEKKISIMRQKHDLRIVKPYAQKWIDLLHWRVFMKKLSLKRHSPLISPVPPKRIKLFPTPEVKLAQLKQAIREKTSLILQRRYFNVWRLNAHQKAQKRRRRYIPEPDEFLDRLAAKQVHSPFIPPMKSKKLIPLK